MRRLALMVLTLVGCGEEAARGPIAPDLVPFVDTNPDPAIVEVSLIAEPARWELLPGKPASVWAFRDGAGADNVGTIPGPLLEASAGQRVIVHFENRLPESTTIHWHGLRVPNAADGTPVAQMPVAPGQQYVYEFTVEDVGLFWYHPHVNGEVQVERGLYGPIRFTGETAPDVAADRVFVLDDAKVEASGELSEGTDDLDIMLGRQGNIQLVNGRQRPMLQSASGTRERWRFVNAANGRYFNLEVPGRSLRVIGWDGGLVAEPYDVQTLLLAPGERYDVLIELGGSDGDQLELRNTYYDRGHDIPDTGPKTLMDIALGTAGPSPAPLPTRWGDVTALPYDAATPRRSFDLREEQLPGAEPTFTINDERYPDITPITGESGAIEIWQVHNLTEMDHPFHLHGMSFQVVGGRLGWKDTVNVPREQTVELVVEIGGPGLWMYHCHILEHAERGMMGELHVAVP